MKKKVLNVILAVLMVVSLLPVAALAMEAPPDSPPHTHGTDVIYEKEIKTFADLQNLFTNGGRGYLAADIECTAALTVSEDVSLCLNDKVLNLNSQGNITVSSEKVFNLTDCGSTVRYYDKTARLKAWKLIASGTSDYSTKGGVITGGSATSGAGIYNNGKFNMTGGSIVGNTATSNGGGVYNAGTFNMTGGTISGNTATNGGGVYDSGVLSLTGSGLITGNIGKSFGGGAYVSGRFNMLGNSGITSNDCGNSGGGVYINNTGEFLMSDGSIDHNTASDDGGGIYDAGSISLGGAAKINDNIWLNKGANTPQNLHMPSGKKITLGTGNSGNGIPVPATGMSVGITLINTHNGILTEENSTDYSARFTADDKVNTKVVNLTGNILKLVKKYDVTVDAGITNGTVITDATDSKAFEGDIVTLTVTPDTGYQLETLSVAPTAGGDPITATQDAQNETKYTFIMPDYAVTVTAEFLNSATDISGATINVSGSPVYADGVAIDPDTFGITVTLDSGEVIPDDAYTLCFYSDISCTPDSEVTTITDAGVYYVVAKGAETEGYTGTTNALPVKVYKAALPKPEAVKDITYDGTEKTGVKLPDGADASKYSISGDKATEIGGYQAKIALAKPTSYCWAGENGDPANTKESQPFTIDWQIDPASKVTHDVKFMVDGTVYDEQKVEDGDFAKKPADPQKTGSKFNGWFESETATGSAFDFEKTPIMADQTLYAGWTKDAAVLDGIEISKAPDKTTYIEGETFDKTGMVITAIYSDGSREAVTGFTVTPAGALQKTDTSVEISYTENGVTKTAKQTIQVNATTDPTPTPTPTPVPYKIIQGANQDIYENAESATFRSDADYRKFLYVEVDGKKLSKNDYKSRTGSTVIVLKASFIKKLALGVHTLKIVSSDGSATTKFTIRKMPPTGDDTPVALLGLLLVSAIGMTVLIIRKRKA